MIARTLFASINKEIKTAIQDTLDELKQNAPSYYGLFLADGEYLKDRDVPTSRLSPYVIDNRMDTYMDESRFRFLSEFLTQMFPIILTCIFQAAVMFITGAILMWM